MKVYSKRNDVARNTDPESNIEITPNHTTASLSLVKTVHCSLPSLKMYLKYLRLSLRDDSKLRRSRELKYRAIILQCSAASCEAIQKLMETLRWEALSHVLHPPVIAPSHFILYMMPDLSEKPFHSFEEVKLA
ncbi:hypothetical protein CEXT_722041 [Caerostris extrusa]|uniref:Uncharacterized protein n=1 Tax=Caerostris extrusa TaxID=172846 RepID=A0AAV4XK83_CAEEX|nr:hypothetical protein CEXT_722041 [Caerostris extrusa]